MTNPGILLDHVVASVVAVESLIYDELHGDPALVIAYRDRYSSETSLQNAVLNAPKPSILCAYMGLQPGTFGSGEVDRHKFTLYFRARDTADEDSYYNMLTKLVTGENADGVPWRYVDIHESCYPPSQIRFDRMPNADELDFWALSFFLVEAGG